MSGWSEKWKTVHLALAPFGVILVTWLLTLSAGAWRWNNRDDLDLAGTLAPLAAAVYGAIVLTIEGGIRVFWALAQIEKDRKTFRAEGREEGREEGRQELAEQIREAAAQSGQIRAEEIERLLDSVLNGETGHPHADDRPYRRRRRRNGRRRRPGDSS